MKELGEWLRRQREGKGISRTELQELTKISLNYIVAIEEGHFEALPQGGYKRAFLRTYARGLGLDPDSVMARYCEIAAEDRLEASPRESTDRRGKAGPRRLVRTLLAVYNGTMEWLGM
ncbi:MAG: helix-turn-helix domain-containing protein [Firmicutes bacterium]|mgnify:CR=1 FL=1|nr:helix-turn-helix domain-containing protein [Bacillota bacterium]